MFNTTNPYFNKFNYTPEQMLMQDLADESIRIKGIDVYYLPRTLVNEDRLLGEDLSSLFDDAYSIPMYIESIEAFEGQGDFLSRFGLEIDDQLTLVVSRRLFPEIVPNNVKNKPNEGDLIFFPLSNTVWEIKFVEDELPFFQFGKNYTYQMKCSLFTYSSERFDTDIVIVDDIERLNAYAVDITLDQGSGNYTVDETVTQPGTNVSATVVSWDAPTKVLRVNSTTYTVNLTANVLGSSSTAEYTIGHAEEIEMPTYTDARNEEFESEGNVVVNWEESSPFGEF